MHGQARSDGVAGRAPLKNSLCSSSRPPTTHGFKMPPGVRTWSAAESQNVARFLSAPRFRTTRQWVWKPGRFKRQTPRLRRFHHVQRLTMRCVLRLASVAAMEAISPSTRGVRGSSTAHSSSAICGWRAPRVALRLLRSRHTRRNPCGPRPSLRLPWRSVLPAPTGGSPPAAWRGPVRPAGAHPRPIRQP